MCHYDNVQSVNRNFLVIGDLRVRSKGGRIQMKLAFRKCTFAIWRGLRMTPDTEVLSRQVFAY